MANDRNYAEIGTTFLKAVLAKIGNAEMRQAWEGHLTHPDVKPALEFAGQGAFFQSDYSRAMDDLASKTTALDTERTALAQKEETLNTWWETNHPKVLAYDKAVQDGKLGTGGGNTGGTGGGTNTGTNDGKVTFTKDELSKFVDDHMRAAEVDAAGYMETISYLQAKHNLAFQDAFNPTDLRTFAQQKRLPLIDAYNLMFKEQYDKRKADQKLADEEKIRADEREKVRKEFSGHMPYPMHRRSAEPSTLDKIETVTGTKEHAEQVDAAVAAYEALQAARAG